MYSQEFIIEGSVTDTQGIPLAGAHIRHQSTGEVVISNNYGKFMVTGLTAGSHTLKVSYVGYISQQKSFSINTDSIQNANFVLQEASYLAEEAVVTATGNKVARRDVSPAISIVPRETLEDSKESALLPLLNEQVPGLFVTERGITGFGVASGAAGHMSIRGVGGYPNTGILVLIDGSPQYMGLFGHPLPDAYVTTDAEKVEVIRGPASMMYGSNAMAGVINIITRKQDDHGLEGRARLSYGSFNTFKASANAGYKHKGFSVFASINHDRTDGHRENSSFEITNAYFKLGYELSKNLRITADGSIASFTSVDPGPASTSDSSYLFEEHWVDILRNMLSFSFENTFEHAEGAIKLFYNSGRHKIYDGFLSKDFNYGFSLYENIQIFRKTNLSAGFDFKNYGGKAENEFAMAGQGILFADTSLHELGGYLMLRQEIATKWILTAGIRLNHQNNTGKEWVPQFGINYLINNNNILKASVSKGFRYPTIRELYMWQAANPNLMPERMWCYEGSYLGSLPAGKLNFEFTAYYQEGDNLIQTIGQYPDIVYENTGDFSHYGIEVSVNWAPWEFIGLESNYSWLHMEDILIGAPEHQWFSSIKYHQNRFSANLSGMYIHGLSTSISPESIEQYFLLNARVSYALYDFLTLWVSGENLLNTEYQTNYDYPMPGIYVLGGIDINFKGKKK